MNKIFRKAVTVLSGVALIGATIGGAVAASYPAPFTSNTAVVYGANAASSDFQAAQNIVSNLNSVSTSGSGSLEGADESIFEDEVTLRDAIDASGSDIPSIIVSGSGKSKLSGLIKEKINWNDGTGSSNYDVEERILIDDDMKVITRLDKEKLSDDVALTNEKALGYQLYFKSLFNASSVGTDDADTLYLEILGKQWEITGMDEDKSTITVVTSKQYTLGVGESVSVNGQSFTVNSIFDGSVEVNGEIIAKDSNKKISGMRVEVDNLGYQPNAPELSRAILKIGEDIQKVYKSGEEYIGEDSKDPLWIWDISLTTGGESWIGVTYAANIDGPKAPVGGDVIKYPGEAYIFPDNWGQVKLDGLNSVNYEDLTIYFETEDLYINDDTSDVMKSGAEVIVIEGKDTETITTGGKETNKIFIYYNTTAGAIQTYYRDWDGDYTPSGRMRLANGSVLSDVGSATAATVTVGDTDLNIVMNVTPISGANQTFLQIVNTEDSSVVLKSSIGGGVIDATAGTFKQFGTDAEGTATAGDAVFSGVEVSTKEYSYMDAYGIKIADGSTVKSNVESDEIILSIPDEQVYAKVSVSIGGSPSGEAGAIILKDTETAQMSGKNLIVVGGSAINAVAAELLEGAYSEEAFTAVTGVDTGKFLIQSFNRAGRTALLVAGYHAADTEKATVYLLNQNVDTTVGKKYVGTSATSATTVTI